MLPTALPVAQVGTQPQGLWDEVQREQGVRGAAWHQPGLTDASLQKVHEMLKKGWDTEGSPFRGQKFDPSMFNISPGAVQF